MKRIAADPSATPLPPHTPTDARRAFEGAEFSVRRVALALAAALAVSGALAEDRVIKGLQDFGSGIQLSSRAGQPITTSISKDGPWLEAVIPKDFNWRWKGWGGDKDLPLLSCPLAALSGPFLPPEADAVRMKVMAISGRAVVAIGGPVSQIGNSDVFCDPKLIEAGTGWQTIEFSLNQPAVRNFRRPNFTRNLPVIYYTRWAQEPLRLYLLAVPEKLRPEGETVLRFDKVELVAKGEGKPFPKFADSDVVAKSGIVNFASGAEDLSKVFSVAHGYSPIESFEQGYRRATPGPKTPPAQALASSPFIREEGISYPAPRFSLTETGSGGKALRAECVWAEEGQIVTFKTQGDPAANAFRIQLKANFPNLAKGFATDAASHESRAVDFVVFVSPNGTSDFPWQSLAPKPELVQALEQSGYQGPGAKFDYLLTTQKNSCANVQDIHQAGPFGFYTTRRLLPADKWADVVLPYADFVCVYGQGECEKLQLGQKPLDPKQIAAVGILAPFGSGHGDLSIKSLSYVSVPGTPEQLRSYWQAPATTKLFRLPDQDSLLMTSEANAPEYLGKSSPAGKE